MIHLIVQAKTMELARCMILRHQSRLILTTLSKSMEESYLLFVGNPAETQCGGGEDPSKNTYARANSVIINPCSTT